MHDDVHGECVCCGWMQVAHEGMFLVGCSWLRSILYSNQMLLLEANVSTAIVQSSSEHTQHAKTMLCMLWWRLQNSSRNVGFFPIKHLVGIKDTS